MAEFARVASIDDLRALRAGLLRFLEAVEQAAVEADVSIERTLEWLRRDQAAHWKGQVRRCRENVQRAKRALELKKMVPTASGLPPSTVDQEGALAAARRRLDEAEQKLRAVGVWVQRLEKQRIAYKASMGSVRALIDSDLPKAVAELDRMLESLDAYVALEAPGAEVALDPTAARAAQGPDPDESGAGPRRPDPEQDQDDEPGQQQG
ncbi:MAG TPA: hypothetical protein VM695_13885 [Phycisphaerae bacterium]|nr:hypothetical protein [Phycisphaerae bacterium]